MRDMQVFDKFIETIRIEHKKIFNIKYHNKRVKKSIKDIYGIDTDIELLDYIDVPKDNNLYRCRVVYSNKIESIEYILQPKREFNTFKIVKDNDIEYKYKSINRDNINNLVSQKNSADDIIIVKESLITDTSIANIAIYTDRWYTPKSPLLDGTYRQKLIDDGFLGIKDITIDELKSAKKVAIMNALLQFYEIKDIKLI
jgi:4-amino-4-deoxychorismate lyase